MHTNNAIFDMIFEDAFNDMCKYEPDIYELLETFIIGIDSDNLKVQDFTKLTDILNEYIVYNMKPYNASIGILSEGRIFNKADEAFNNKMSTFDPHLLKKAYSEYREGVKNAVNEPAPLKQGLKSWAQAHGKGITNLGKAALQGTGQHLQGLYSAAKGAMGEFQKRREYLGNAKKAWQENKSVPAPSEPIRPTAIKDAFNKGYNA